MGNFSIFIGLASEIANSKLYSCLGARYTVILGSQCLVPLFDLFFKVYMTRKFLFFLAKEY